MPPIPDEHAEHMVQQEVDRRDQLRRMNILEKDLESLEKKTTEKFEGIELEFNTFRSIVALAQSLKKLVIGLLLTVLGSIATKLIDLLNITLR